MESEWTMFRTSTADVVRWWKEHFEDLFNLAGMSFIKKAACENLGEDSAIILAEVVEAVKKLLPLGVDKICPKMLKALDMVWLS